MTRSYPTTPMCSGAILEAFEPTVRESDVFVATAAKSGQTWLLTLLHHLKTRGTDPALGGVGLHANTPWLEIPRNLATGQAYETGVRLAQLEALGDPRIFKLHVVYEEVPRPPGSTAPVITITRDPRELPWSMYCHLRGMKEHLRPTSVANGFDAYFESWMDFGYFFKLVNSFWPHRDDPDVLWLRYEDLHADLPGQSRRIVDFLGWDRSDDDIERAAPLASFGHMQSQEKTTLFREAESVWQDDKRFFRRGAVGENRTHLSPEQEARIVARAREVFEPACFDWVMSLPE